MDKLLKHIMNAKNVSNKFLPHLTKAQYGKQVKSNPGQTVVVDGKRMNTNSDEYEQVYKKGIGQWRKYDSTTGQWNLLANNLPSSAYNNAEFVSSERNLPEVTVSAKMNPFVSAARKKAKEQAGSLDAFRKQEEASYPKWYKNTSLYNPEKDSQTQEETYNSVVNRGTYQNLVDAIPQKENESRVNYINRFNNLAGKNAVSLARQANVTEPFDPNNLYKLGQWGWKGLNHIAAVNQAFSPSNTRGFRSTIQEGINRGNMPIPGMLSDDAKQIGITQPFDTVDDLAFRYGFKPLLKAGDNLTDPTGEQSRAFNSRYLGASETDKVFTSLMNPLNYIAGAEILKGAKGLGDAIKTPLRTASVAQKNLKDLNYAKKVYGPLGYKIPENLERIAQSDLLTDRTIRGLVNRDNSFYRGVSNLETLKQKLENKRPLITSKGPQGYDPMDTYNTLVDQLKKSGVDITNEEEVAKYMATHIPGETGGGRANLDENIFKKGLDALYTSNSEGTAEGYTYGKGFIVKAKKPTDFSFPDRKSWIDYNNPDIQARNKYRLPFLSSKPISWKTDYKKLDDKFINNYREELGAERLRKEYPDAFAFGVRHWENGNYPEVKKVFDRIGELRTASRENFSKAHDPLLDKIRKVDKRIESRVEKFKKSNMPMPVKFLQGITNPAFVRDMVLDQYYGNLSRKLRKSSEKEWEAASYIPYLERYPDLATVMPEADPYAHYLHIGKPGQKVLEPMSLRKISPDTWKRTSRAHDGKYSRQATRREFGGAYDNAEYNMGGQPCYECGGSVKRYDVGGYYDCPDQEKDPVTGKCKAEVVRGREANAANKAAGKEMNAWAKQVAAMDKELAKQYAAQDAGQLTFDYDWMQTPLDKADKKAAVAGYKQFFQQNPNVFVADDTSGYSPEQKYIIASKLKQRMSTPMGSKLVQQKYGVDPRFYDLQRIQSDFAPKMGGWDGMRNFLFNTYKQQGGQYDLPQAQWGSFINPVDMGLMASKVMNFFGLNKPKIVRTPASAPKRLSIRDPRKVMMTTGKPLRPNSDLVTGQYDSEHLGNLMTEAKRRKMSYNDMMNLAAMGFQETKWGRSDDNIGHTKGEFGDEPMQDSYSNFIDAYNAKMKDADRLKIKDEATRLQVYNGLGKIFPSTEAGYHGFNMKKIYGVPVPKGGIDLRKNPLYGKQVIDIRDNVLKRNPEFMRYMDSTYRAPMPKEEFANGGSFNLPKMQLAGQNNNTPQRVSINDPRYAELYKNRQVGSYYDGAYSLPDLPEVTVTGKDERIKEGMSKGSGKFYKGLAGVMSAPQVVTMELLTGKQQTPSQAWGFDTKDKSWYHPKSISNFAMDTVLDPLNALGVGIADDIAKTTLKGIGRKIATPNSAPLGNIKSSIDDLKRGYDLKGTGFEEDPFYHNQLFEDRRKSAIERLSTDKGRQRLQDFIDDNYKKNPKNFGTENSTLSQWFKSGFKDYTKITPDKVIDDLKKMEFTTGNKDNAFHWFNKGLSKPSVMNIGEGITPYDALHTFEHELGHFFQRNKPSNVDDILSKLKLKKEEDPIKLNVFRSEVPLLEPGYSTTRLDPNYNNFIYPKDYFETGSRGQEKMPFAAEVRENLLQRGVIKDYYDDITPDILRKHKDIYDKTGGLKYTQRLYEIMEDSPENLNILSQALNKMPQVVLPVAGGALAVKSSLNEKKKQGGPILDPRGQWAHPGKVTRIPGSDITMQGVPYPVYGVGSNGQEQMMYPNQEYDFGGASYVDEYPMMANGGYTVTRSNDRKGKTHKVTGPGGVVKYFGDSKLGQHPKDPERKAAFYARHKKNLAGNPFFRAFARKTWEDGGETDYMQGGGLWDTDKVGYLDSTINANRNLEFIRRAIENDGLSIPTPKGAPGYGKGMTSSHLMTFDPKSRRSYPELVNMNGTLKYLTGDDAYNYAEDTGEYIQFPTAEQADYFSQNYKKSNYVKVGKQPLEKKHGIKVTYKK